MILLVSRSNVRWSTWVLFLLLSVLITTEGKPRYFGDQYACRCKRPESCDTVTGGCGTDGCQSGWMGPSCQFVNIAEDATVYSGSQRSTVLTDNDEKTCTYRPRGQYTIDITWDHPRWITWIQVKANIGDAPRHLEVEVYTPDDFVLCDSMYNTSESINIFCKTPVPAETVRLAFQNLRYSSVCEVQISGGVNVAINKESNQTSDYTDDFKTTYTSDLAIDGDTNTIFEGGSCSHTLASGCGKYKKSQWAVNLQRAYRVQMYRIYNRKNHLRRLANFKLQTKMVDSERWSTVYSDTSGYPDEITVLIPTSLADVNYVKVKMPRCQILTLCEVEIFAALDCDDSTYGFNCGGYCNCKNETEVCNKITGHCDSGCAPGFTGDGCQLECPEGYFGDGCKRFCVRCLKNICYSDDGSCTEGCSAGWTEDSYPLCDRACNNGTFGIGCQFSCRCHDVNDVCTKDTGYCPSGCSAGYRGLGCQEECPAGTFGSGCNQDCSSGCLESSCDGKTGKCNRGCTVGLQGDFCNRTCDVDFYGINCSKICNDNCKAQFPNRACFATDGICTSGCKPGWRDQSYCNQTCLPGFYGEMCLESCNVNCRERQCHHVNGFCTLGCVKGKQGDMCRDDCDVGYFGDDCSSTCSEGCLNQRCSPKYGVCIEGCSPGWFGNNCTEACSFGQYGQDCNLNCSQTCIGQACHHISGDCTEGCTVGYKGRSCSEDCGAGQWGSGCKMTCSDGCEGSVCNSTDGSCSCMAGRQGLLCDVPTSTGLEGMSTGAVAGVSGVIVGLLVVIVVVIVVFRLRKRRAVVKNETGVHFNNKTKDSLTKIKLHKPTAHSGSSSSRTLLVDGAVTNDKKTDDVYYNVGATSSSTMVLLENFPDYVRKWRNNANYLHEEFEKIPKELIHDRNVALSAKNMGKNRYKNICAYDHSRVVLPIPPDNDQAGDYINACYIHSPKKEKSFIASQGPNKVILNDFVRMLWELDIKKVVMLTNLIEDGKTKCDQYWPDTGKKTFGNVSVFLKETMAHADYTIRRLRLNMEGRKAKLVTQFHYTAWPDKGVPKSPWSLVDFRDKVMTSGSTGHSPVVVHCSAGIGRTGTFIALQNLKEEAELEGTQDVYACVWKLRQQRVNMVQTKDQYVFVHEAALVSLITSRSTMSWENFLQQTEQWDPRRLQKEFQVIQECPVSTDSDEYTIATENSTKNRNPGILAGESHRATLRATADMPCTYINAVFLPGYNTGTRFIQTQTPLTNTVNDFWRMVIDHNVATVVMLDNYTQSDGDAAVYWPEVHCPLELSFCSIICSTVFQNNLAKVRQLQVQQGQSLRAVTQYVAKFWPEEGLPDAPSFLQFLRMSEVQQAKADQPIIVHCRSGAGQSGIFCSISAVLERLALDNTLAVPVVVGNIRTVRSQNISTLDQYKFIYTAIQEELPSESVYSNVGAPNVDDTEDNENVYSNVQGDPVYCNQ